MLDPHWSLVATGPNQERRVGKELDRLAVASLMFFRNVTRVVRGHYVKATVPAWPGYIFVKPQNAWEAVRDIRGVIDFVRFGPEPARVSDEVIDSLLTYAPGGVLPAETKVAKFKFGQQVRFRNPGLMFGYSGIYQHNVDDHRVIVLQEWLGRFVPIELNEDDIEAEIPRSKKYRRNRRHRRNAGPRDRTRTKD